MNTQQNNRVIAEEYWKLLRRYKHVRELLEDANPDLPRWIFDNIVKPLTDKQHE